MVTACHSLHAWDLGAALARGTGWREVVVQTRREALQLLRAICAALKDQGYGEADLSAVSLAVEEALANALEHGIRNDPRKRVYCRFCVDSEKVLVELEDEGSGFDPYAVPDPTLPENRERPRGRGLFMIRYVMTGVSFNQRGNCIRMGRSRSQ